MAEVGSAFVSVLPSAKGFGSKLNSEIGPDLNKSGKSVGAKFGSALKYGATAAVGGALVAGAFLKGAIGEAREAQKVGALTNAVIKSTGGVAHVAASSVDELATSISLKTGVDDEAIAAGENMLLTFTNVRNEIGEGNNIFAQATVAANDMAAAFGGDAVSNSKILGKALNDPTTGVSALTRVGVSFTDQQKEQIKTMQKSGNILGAQKLVLGELTKQTAGAAEASATAGDKFKVSFDNFRESVGTAILPLVDKIEVGLTKFVTLLTNDIGPGIAALNGYLAPAIAATMRFFGTLRGGSATTSALMVTVMQIANSLRANLMPPLQAAASTFRTVVWPAIVQVSAYLQAKLVPIFIKVGQIIAQQVIPMLSELATWFYSKVVPAVYQVAGVIAQKLRPTFDELARVIMTQVIPALQRGLTKLHEWQPTIQRVTEVIIKIVGWFAIFQASILGQVLPPLIKVISLIVRLAWAMGGTIKVIGQLIGWLRSAGDAMGEAGKKAGDFTASVISKFNAAVAFVAGIPGRLLAALGDLGSLLFNAGGELVQGLINGITSKIGALMSKMAELANVIRDHLPGSPVKRGPLVSWNNGGAGKRLVELLAYGLSDTRPVESAMNTLAGRVAAPRAPQLAVAGGGATTAGLGGGLSRRDIEAIAAAVHDGAFKGTRAGNSEKGALLHAARRT